MNSSHDIYQIIENLDAAQKQVKQLPALFKPKDTSPQLAGPYPGKNATRGYLVGEGEDSGRDNPMAGAIIRRIVNQHPEWIVKYGVENLLQVIDDVTEGDWEEDQEIGSSDVSAYVHMVSDRLRDQMGSKEEMDEGLRDPEDNPCWKGYHPVGTKQKNGRTVPNCVPKEDINEAHATEDVLSTMKKKLGDYLQDVATAIKKDPDLLDKVDKAIDQVGPAVKTLQTDDGHEIKIHGNEDDGFRISIKNRPSKTAFKSLDEATMAVEMYCNRRKQTAMSADYIEEKRS